MNQLLLQLQLFIITKISLPLSYWNYLIINNRLSPYPYLVIKGVTPANIWTLRSEVIYEHNQIILDLTEAEIYVDNLLTQYEERISTLADLKGHGPKSLILSKIQKGNLRILQLEFKKMTFSVYVSELLINKNIDLRSYDLRSYE